MKLIWSILKHILMWTGLIAVLIFIEVGSILLILRYLPDIANTVVAVVWGIFFFSISFATIISKLS